jgi:aspartate aminotransferase
MKLSPSVSALKPSDTIAAAAKARELKSRGIEVFEFTLGEPDFNTPEHIRQAALDAMTAGHTHYTPAGGILPLKEAVCHFYKRDYGIDFSPKQVIISNGAKHSIHNVLSALIAPGDEVVIPTPYWVSYSALVELVGGIPVLVDSTEAEGFVISIEKLQKAITPNTTLIMINSPSNPTGVVYPPELLEQIGNLAIENDLYILSDEIYEKLIYPGSTFRSMASFSPEITERTIIVSGVSKAYAMTGWRIGWTVGPVELIQGIDKLQSQQTSNPCSISQYASVAALTGSQDSVKKMLEAFTERREYVISRFKKIPGLSFVEPGGAFYVFFNVTQFYGKPLMNGRVSNNSLEMAAAILEEAHVGLVAGDGFGAPGYVRMSFAASMERLEKGMDQLEAFFTA